MNSRVLRNPILPGFHPDPCILRVGDDYWIATSTFEWFPGVRLHHSRDLVHWDPIGYALDRTSQLDMRGNLRSGGVWAPQLSFAHGQFHLVYTNVKSWSLGFNDCHNYLVTADDIHGPWSEPIYLNSSGFDPSLFTDEDGRQYLVNMRWDARPGMDRFGGIVLQAYDRDAQRLVGEPKVIFEGTSLGLTEGPHVLRRGSWFYLIVAEGGTSYDHAMTVVRSRSLTGPYEIDPDGPLLTSRDAADAALQKAGHGMMVETQTGEWYVTHLVGRPQGPQRRCVLGRETAMQRIVWNEEGWPRLADGGHTPYVEVAAPDLPPHPFPEAGPRDDFDGPGLGPHWQTLRVPPDPSWLSLRERPGWLRLRGRESPRSQHEQSLVGQRVTSLQSRFETCVSFAPTSFQQMAGLLAFYDDEQFYYAMITHDPEHGAVLAVMGCRHGEHHWVAEPTTAVPEGPIRIAVTFAGDTLHFEWSDNRGPWRVLSPELDATILSDEATSRGLGFTGAFVALGCHDLSGRRAVADFDYLEVREPSP